MPLANAIPNFTFHRTQINIKEERAVSQTGNRISTVSEARCSGEAAAERRRASGDTGDTERRIREGRLRGEVSVRERAWRRSSDAMGGGGGGAEVSGCPFCSSAICSLSGISVSMLGWASGLE
jgi:hypothetical protein